MFHLETSRSQFVFIVNRKCKISRNEYFCDSTFGRKINQNPCMSFSAELHFLIKSFLLLFDLWFWAASSVDFSSTVNSRVCKYFHIRLFRNPSASSIRNVAGTLLTSKRKWVDPVMIFCGGPFHHSVNDRWCWQWCFRS